MSFVFRDLRLHHGQRIIPIRFLAFAEVCVGLSFFYVAVGSMLGGVSRFGLTLATKNITAFGFAYGTLLSNVAGCLIIGLIAGAGVKSEFLTVEMRLLLATGFCGGFTTMSSFVYELAQFVQDKDYFYASGYFAATIAGASLAFFAGLLISGFLVK